MIIRDFYRVREDGVNLYRTYSNENKYIRNISTGNEYTEVINIENAPYQYEETEREIEKFEESLEDFNEDVV